MAIRDLLRITNVTPSLYPAARTNGTFTGSAVDLTLRWKNADQLWMGSIFDDVTAMAHRDTTWALVARGLICTLGRAR